MKTAEQLKDKYRIPRPEVTIGDAMEDVYLFSESGLQERDIEIAREQRDNTLLMQSHYIMKYNHDTRHLGLWKNLLNVAKESPLVTEKKEVPKKKTKEPYCHTCHNKGYISGIEQPCYDCNPGGDFRRL